MAYKPIWERCQAVTGQLKEILKDLTAVAIKKNFISQYCNCSLLQFEIGNIYLWHLF